MSVQFGDADRRGFLRQGVGKWFDRLVEQAEERIVTRRYMRPPGALPEVGMLAACTRCGACAAACPPHAILFVGRDGGLAAGTPYIDAQLQPCTVCPDMPCAAACPTDALTIPSDGWASIRLGELELIPERCITFNGVPCGVCAEACPVGEAALTMDEGGHPVIRREGCVGCGVCVRSCVTSPRSLRLTMMER